MIRQCRKTSLIGLALVLLSGCASGPEPTVDINCRVVQHSKPELIKIGEQLGCITSQVISETIIDIGTTTARSAGQNAGR
ncbi:MAG: hypothetical protein RSG77_19610 [Hafnia sp.]